MKQLRSREQPAKTRNTQRKGKRGKNTLASRAFIKGRSTCNATLFSIVRKVQNCRSRARRNQKTRTNEQTNDKNTNPTVRRICSPFHGDLPPFLILPFAHVGGGGGGREGVDLQSRAVSCARAEPKTRLKIIRENRGGRERGGGREGGYDVPETYRGREGSRPNVTSAGRYLVHAPHVYFIGRVSHGVAR